MVTEGDEGCDGLDVRSCCWWRPDSRERGGDRRAKKEFVRFCAKCHGTNGKGDGPQADALTTKPHDFTDCARMKAISDDTLFTAIKEGGEAAHLNDMPHGRKGGRRRGPRSRRIVAASPANSVHRRLDDNVAALPAEARDLWWFPADVPCLEACPVKTDAARYVQLIAEGRLAEAYRVARAPKPIASICGRTCGRPARTRAGAARSTSRRSAAQAFRHQN